MTSARHAFAGILLMMALSIVGSAGAATPVVSNLKYSPNPLYDDDSLVLVTFTTSRAAKPGYEWGVLVSSFGKAPVLSCTSIANSWDPLFGGKAGDHMRTAGKHSRIVLGTRYDYWCRGKASISIVEHKIGQRFAIGRPLGDGSDIYFRVPAAP